MRRSLFLCVAAILIMSVAASAAVMSYQGHLTDGSGAMVPDGNYLINFTIFDDSTGGAKLWEETHPAVPVANGMFMVLLGSIDPLNDGGYQDSAPDGAYLEISVNGDNPIAPRGLLTSTPQAMSAYRLNGDLITMPGILEVHPPEPGIGPPFYPGFRLKVDSTSSNWQLQPPDPVIPEDTCRGMGATVSIELVQLDLSSPTPWSDPCDSINGILLVVDSAKSSVQLVHATEDDSTVVKLSASESDPEALIVRFGAKTADEGSSHGATGRRNLSTGKVFAARDKFIQSQGIF